MINYVPGLDDDLWSRINVLTGLLAFIWMARVSYKTRVYALPPRPKWKFFGRLPFPTTQGVSRVRLWGFGAFWMTMGMNMRLIFWGPILWLSGPNFWKLNPLGNDANLVFHLIFFVSAHYMLVALAKKDK